MSGLVAHTDHGLYLHVIEQMLLDGYTFKAVEGGGITAYIEGADFTIYHHRSIGELVEMVSASGPARNAREARAHMAMEATA